MYYFIDQCTCQSHYECSSITLDPSRDCISCVKGEAYGTYLSTTNILPSTDIVWNVLSYTGRFIMFSVITNICNKKTKGPALMELFTATRKLITFFFGQLEMFDVAPRVTRHTSIRYLSSCHTRVNMGASIFFTAAIIRDFRSPRSRGNGTLRILHEMHVAR